MKPNYQQKANSNIEKYYTNQNPFSAKGKQSISKNNINVLSKNINKKRNPKRNLMNDSRKSFDNIHNQYFNHKGFNIYNTQKSITKMSSKNRILTTSSNLENNFILAKKNNLYASQINNNEQMNLYRNNNNFQLNGDVFAKKIKFKLNKKELQTRNKMLINANMVNNFNNQTYNSKKRNINDFDTNEAINIPQKTIRNKYPQLIADDILHIFDLNSTMPNAIFNKDVLSSYNKNNFTEKKNINKNENNNMRFNKVINIKNLSNIKLFNQKLIKKKNINQIQKKISLNRNTKRIPNKIKDADLSWDFGSGLANNGQTSNFYKKAKSGIIANNHKSALYKRNSNLTQNQNDEDLSDKELDKIVDDLNLFLETDEKKINNTYIEKGNNFSKDSFNLSDLADDIVKFNPEIETDDQNIQETVPSTSNPDIEGVFDINNNNNINMSNINNNNPFGNNKISNMKPFIVNNIFISSHNIKKKNNKKKKDINYDVLILNEYNNPGNNINNDTKSKTNLTDINIPVFETKTYKSPFNLKNSINKINSKDINEIEDSEINAEFSEFENKNYNSKKVEQNIIQNLNKSNNINHNSSASGKLKINSSKKEEQSLTNISDNKNKFGKEINNKKKSKNNLNEMMYSDSLLRDLLSSHKNTPSINNLQMPEENKFTKLNNKYIKNEIGFIKNDEKLIYNNERNNWLPYNKIKNSYFSEQNEENNIIIKHSMIKTLPKKTKKHVLFNLNNNTYIKFGKEDLITDSQVTDESGKIYNHIEKDMDLYNAELKVAKPKSIIKKNIPYDIKINHEYVWVENLPERQILPDLYDEFEEQDLKSLEKTLEKSVDKILH